MKEEEEEEEDEMGKRTRDRGTKKREKGRDAPTKGRKARRGEAPDTSKPVCGSTLHKFYVPGGFSLKPSYREARLFKGNQAVRVRREI